MKSSVKILCMSRAESPITHMLGTVGNEAVVNTEPVRTSLGVRHVPVMSGNAIRHRMIRSPAADYLIDVLDLDGGLTKDELNLLYHGGLRRESGNRVSLQRTAEMERLLPMLRLLGCCLPDNIYPGSLIALRGMLVCRENENRIRNLVPDDWWVENSRLAPANSFIERWQYVRGEVRTSTKHRKPSDSERIDKKEDGKKSDSMPFSGTQVVAGSEWLHGFILRYPSELDIGCLLHSISRWQDEGATIGGQFSRGHGKLSISLSVIGDSDVDVESCISEYKRHVMEFGDEARDFLKSLYEAPKTRKTKKT